MRSPAVFVLAASLVALAPRAAAAQQKFEYIGPNRCLNCHDHSAEKTWYESRELLEVKRVFPEKGANAGHINSQTQLDAPKSDEFAKAIGLADKYDVKGACVSCHATVFQGEANAGVSCESCHGPGSAYLQPHQTKGSYDQAVAQYGMTRLIGNLQGWTQQCTNCHVMDDDRLIKAGHPSGDDFDLSKKYQPVSLHFKKSYTAAEVDAVAKTQMEGIMRRRRPNSAPLTPIATAPPDAPPVVAPPPPPPADPPATGAPRPAPRPRPAAVSPAAPPAGSPTSIEPPPPPPGDPAPPAAAPAPSSAPAAPPAAARDDSSSFLATNWPWMAAVLLVGLGALVWASRRKR